MKVTTDCCLFGAIIANEFSGIKNLKILDIGTGTGLLSLMLAQKNESAYIDAVEIDHDAAIQADENFKASIFSKQITLHHADIKQFHSDIKYDLIICNPPFYEDDLKSPDAKRNKALHDSALLLDELINIVPKQMNENGILAVLLPAKRTAGFFMSAKNQALYCYKNFEVRQTENHSVFRNILFFSRKNTATEIASLTIKIKQEYSVAFKNLLKDYYMYL